MVKAYGNSPIRLMDNIMKNIVVNTGVHGAAFCFVFWNRSLMASKRVFSHK